MAEFLDLQNGWYNGFTQGMGQQAKTFQIIQPAPPLLSNDRANTLLWSYFNNIPPESLTQNFIASGGNQFYNDYRGLMSALEPTRDVDIKGDIGPDNFNSWQQYVQKLRTPPTINQLPTLFRSWALMNAPRVANKGASDYAAILLDPVASAQTELTLVYTDAEGQAKPFDWSLDYTDLDAQLASAPDRSVTFDSQKASSDVKKTWTAGSNSGFFGLWGNSSSKSTLSEKFASSKVQIECSFEHVFEFFASPGNWYGSSGIGLAFANQTGNPWSPKSSINWENTFGSKGNMERFMANLIVCSGMKATITSSASYSTAEQTEIHNNSHAGFWPFYCTGSGHDSTNTVTFSEDDKLTVTTNSVPGVPVVLGGNVLSAAEFLGHAEETSKQMVEALMASHAVYR